MTSRAARVAEVTIAALLWAVLAIGASVQVLTAPAYTSALERAIGVPAEAGLSATDTLHLAGQVRALVADPGFEPLPSTWRGQPAFDAASVSHLMDVRKVIGAARLVTGVVALLLAIYTGWCVARRRLVRLASGMNWGALALAVATVAAVVAALTSFDAFFAAFHGLFFAAGTWTFPADSMLIRLFPEAFWEVSGAAWGALVVVSAAILAVCSRLMRGAAARGDASRTTKDV